VRALSATSANKQIGNTMFKKSFFTALTLVVFSASAFADLMPWKDYQESDAVWSVSTIRVDANMDDAYLEGIKKTWVTSNEAQKKLGHIESYTMFRSVSPQSGDFNLLLIVKFKDSAAMAPNKARYDAFMKEMGDANVKASNEYSQKNYPAMRTITGEYLMREITLK
jgi:hypothetical protein